MYQRIQPVFLEKDECVRTAALPELVFAGNSIIPENLWWNWVFSQLSVPNCGTELKSRRKHYFIRFFAHGGPVVPEK